MYTMLYGLLFIVLIFWLPIVILKEMQLYHCFLRCGKPYNHGQSLQLSTIVINDNIGIRYT